MPYLGLTGHRLDAADALHSGLATHFVPADGLDAVADALAGNPGGPVDVVLNRPADRSPVSENGLAAIRGTTSTPPLEITHALLARGRQRTLRECGTRSITGTGMGPRRPSRAIYA